jgi:type IV fimbrial biogenesis protein FimT
MARRGDKTNRGGFTLVEILIALAIVGIVVMLATSTFQGMMEKYRVEGETKQMFTDLMDARGRAMQRNRAFFVQITGNGYSTFEDTNPAPDGNGILESTDAVAVSATVRHTITCNPGGLSDFHFNRNGIPSATGTIRLSSAAQPDYDCITIRETRIKMGQFKATDNTCAEK